MSSKKYYKDLNVIRLLACIAVLLYHLNILKGGYLAVCVFFVLSGYLSCVSAFKKENFSLKEYYSNRLLKIYLPLLVVTFITIFVVSLFSNIVWLNLKPETTSVLLGYNNFWQLSANLDYFVRHVNSPFIHFWYIGILLQFDIIFPFLYIAFKKIGDKVNKIVLCIITLVLGVASAVYLCYAATGTNIMVSYYNTFARAFSLLFGVSLGFIHFYYKPLIPKLFKSETARKIIFYSYNLILILLFIFIDAKSIYFSASMIIVSLITCRLIDYTIISSNKKLSIFDKVIKFLADKSYGIYLVQYPVIFLFQYINLNQYIEFPLMIIIILLLAIILHFCFDKTKKQKTLKYIVLVIIAGLSLCGVYRYIVTEDHTKEMKQLEEQLAQNEKLLKKSQEEYANQIKKEEEDWLSILESLENSESEIATMVNNLPVVGIGDSVMLGAVGNLSEQFPNGYFDAKTSRTGWVVNDILTNLKSKNLLGNIIVLNLGANGDCPESVKISIMEQCKGHEVFWINVTNDSDVHVNDKLNTFAAKYDNLHIIDWNGISKGHKDYFYSDGIHLTSAGRKVYTKTIYDAIYKIYFDEFNEKKEALLNKREEELKSKISFYGNDILLNIFDYLEPNFKDANYIINNEYSYETLKASIQKAINDKTLTHKIVFTFDANFNLTLSQYNELIELCTDHQLYMIFTNQNEFETKDNVEIIDFYKEIKLHKNYLMSDKIHLTKEGNQALSLLIKETLQK